MGSRLAVVSLLGLLAACAGPPPRATGGDEAPEAFVSQARLREVFTQDGDWWVSPVLQAPQGASRVAVWLSTAADAVDAPLHIEVRGFLDNGTVTPWLRAQQRWAEAPQRVLRAELAVSVEGVELRVRDQDVDALARLVWSAVTPDPTVADPVAGDVDAQAPTTAQGALDIAGIEPRSAWGARANAGCDTNTNKDWITVHHSVSALQEGASRNTHAAAVRGIQSYHMDGRGYCDIGYHFATTADGTVWEAREARFLGAHTGSHNTNNAGIVFIGCFHPSADCDGMGATTPPQVMREGGGAAIGRIAQHYGIAIGAGTVIGHRDNPDQTTSCPGDNLHDLLPQLRQIASGGGVVPPATGTVQGVVWDLSITTDASQSQALGARLPGAQVSVTGGPSTTAGEGDSYWSFDLAPGTYTLTAAREGFASASKQVQVTSGQSGWASIGLSPLPQAVALTVHVTDADDGHAIAHASVTVPGADPQQTNADGLVLLSLAAGPTTIDVSAEGYDPQSVQRTLTAGDDVTVDVVLTPVVIDKPGEGEAEPELEGDPQQVERVTLLAPKGAGGCAGTDPDEPGPLGPLTLLCVLLVATWPRRRPSGQLPAR